jgi:hypothetical protein
MTEGWGELATRESDGLVVSLLWSKSANRLKVAVVDTRRGEQFELEAAGTEALAVFHHPFAYAASANDACDKAWREPLNAQQQVGKEHPCRP